MANEVLSQVIASLSGAWILWVSHSIIKLQKDINSAHKKLREK